MPTYVFKCKECETVTEKVMSMTDDPITKCPSCDKHALVKIIQAAGGFRIGGAGVYNPTSCPLE